MHQSPPPGTLLHSLFANLLSFARHNSRCVTEKSRYASNLVLLENLQQLCSQLWPSMPRDVCHVYLLLNNDAWNSLKKMPFCKTSRICSILVCTLVKTHMYCLWFPDISTKLEAFLRVDSVAEGSPSSQAVRNNVYLFLSRSIFICNQWLTVQEIIFILK